MRKSSAIFRTGFGWATWCLAAACGPATAQVDPWTAELRPSPRPLRAGLGLQPLRAEVPVGCGASLLPCATEQAAFAAQQPSSLHWSLELASLDLGPSRSGLGMAPSRHGLNVSLVGRKPVFGSSFSVYGRLGGTLASPEAHGASALAGPTADSGYGLSFGAGVSYDFTPRLSATFGFDSHEMRLGSAGRETLRSTNLGLQFRY